MEQLRLIHEDIYEAISADVQAIGSALAVNGAKSARKVVASMLWPTKQPPQAAELLSSCLNRARAENLDPEQLQFIITQARSVGSYAVMYYMAEQANFEKPEPVEPEDELAKLQREFIHQAKAQEQMLRRIEQLSINNMRPRAVSEVSDS